METFSLRSIVFNSILFCLIILPYSESKAQKLELEPHKIKLRKGVSFTLKIPKGYHVSVAAEGLKRPRFFAKSPDGRLFVTDMYDRGDNFRGRVLVLENWNEKEKRFDKTTKFLDSLHNPNQVAFYTTGKGSFIYVVETDKLSFYPYHAGDARPASPQKIISMFPAYGLHYKYGGWHLTRSLAFNSNKLYVSVGSSCNACIEKEDVRATILEMDPDGKNQKIFASGLRNSVGIKWVGDDLWATTMGRDLIGPDRPEDLFIQVKRGEYYGWPFYYQYKNRIYPDTTFKDSLRNSSVKQPPLAPWGFLAHSAPLGFEYFKGFNDSLLNKSFIVALHGSTSVWRRRGNSVVQLQSNGKYREIITGFLNGRTEDKRYGRPCDVIQWDMNSFFISDDKNGVIYLIWKE